MNKKLVRIIALLTVISTLFVGCSNKTKDADKNNDNTTTTQQQTETKNESEAESQAVALEDGIYEAEFKTDSSMFHVNEALDGKGTLTVKDGKMTIHVSLVSKKILNLYAGLAEDAQKEGAEILEPSEDVVKYDDGSTEEVFGFDIPVPAIDEEFDCALVGEKGTWYDHKVSVTNPVKKDADSENDDANNSANENALPDGAYTTDVVLEGGSGKSTVVSPCEFRVHDGQYFATIEWSSPNYDYMIVNDEKYYPLNSKGNSVFEIPFSVFDEKVAVQADTVAMSKPHLIDYTLTFSSDVTAITE